MKKGQLPGGEKLSGVILNYANEYLIKAKSDEECEEAIGFSIYCWNLVFNSKEEQEIEIKKTIEEFMEPELEVDLREMIDRREKEFGNYNFLITDYEVLFTNSKLQLFVKGEVYS